MFSPKEKTGAVICFKFTFPDGNRSLKFGKNWNMNLKRWWYFEKMPDLPAFACEEACFIPNIVSNAGTLWYIRRSRREQKIVRLK